MSLKLLATIVALTAFTSTAHAITLDFEGLDSTSVIGGPPDAAAVLTNQFASDGIVFGAAGLSAGVAVSNNPSVAFEGTQAILGLDANGEIEFAANSNIYFNFVNNGAAATTDYVSFYVGDTGGDVDTFDISAFDIGGSLLGIVNVSGTAHQFAELTFAGMNSIVVERTNADNAGYGLDLLTFNTPTSVAAIPLPAGMVLLLSGLGAFATTRRRKA